MRRVCVILAMLLASSAVAVAQIVVHDPAVTVRNSVTAIVKEYLLHIQQAQHRQLRRMAQRLSLFTSLDKYTLPDPPRWRTHRGDVLFTQAYNDALTVGDADGTAYLALSHPLASAHQALSRVSPAAFSALRSRLATIDLADATAIAGTHETGQLRFNGRTRELPAIDALEGHVVDPSNEHGATAVLDTISGAVLIGARQRQARTQLLTGIVEQLLVESKRARDADAAALNMQLTVWRDAQAANDAFVADSGDALRTWRQP
jgi:hypothetical protein